MSSNPLTKKIKRALKKIGPTGESFFKYGPVEITFLPDEGVGYIDVVKTEGMGAFDLKKAFMEIKDALPDGKWELNPDTPQKQRIYERWFKNDPTIKPSGDTRMASIGREGFVLTKEPMVLGEVPKSVYEAELEAYKARRAGGNELGVKRVPAQFEYNNKYYTIQKGGAGYQLKHSSERAVKQATRNAVKLKQSPKLSSIEQMMVQNYYDDAVARALQVDHEIPLEKGGLHHPSNMRLLTPTDNAAKGAKLGTSFKPVPLLEDVSRAIGAVVSATPKPVLGLIPVVGMGFDAAEAAERTQRAIKQPTLANKVQAGIAGVGAATTVAPDPISQAVNLGAGVLNMGIDAARYVKQQLTSDQIMRAIGQIKMPTLFP